MQAASGACIRCRSNLEIKSAPSQSVFSGERSGRTALLPTRGQELPFLTLGHMASGKHNKSTQKNLEAIEAV